METGNDCKQNLQFRNSPEQIIPMPPEVRIQEVNNGFIVKVGCQTMVFESRDKLLSELARYLSNREEVNREYMKYK